MFDRLIDEKSAKPRRARSIALSLALHGAAIGAAIAVTLLVKPPPPDEEGPLGPPVIHFPDTRPPPRKGSAGRDSTPSHQIRKKDPPPPLRHVPVEPTVQIKPEPAPVEADPPAPEPTPDIAGPERTGGGSGPTGIPTGDPRGVEDGSGSGDPIGPSVSRPREVEVIESIGAGFSQPHPDCDPPRPPMPAMARQAGIDGLAVMHFVVHADGSVTDVSSISKSTPPILSDAVREWLLGCRFQPATFNGQAKSVRVTQTFRFTLR